MGIIVARDVAVATTIAVSEDIPKLWNRKNKTGTITIPPPTPSRPARVPANIPVAISAKKVKILSDKNSIMPINNDFILNIISKVIVIMHISIFVKYIE